MLACIKTANGKVEMMDLPVPEPAEGEIVIKMSMATVCGTDMHFLDEFPSQVLESPDPGSLKPEGFPMGHEAVGIVHAVGAGRDALSARRPRHLLLPGRLRQVPRVHDGGPQHRAPAAAATWRALRLPGGVLPQSRSPR